MLINLFKTNPKWFWITKISGNQPKFNYIITKSYRTLISYIVKNLFKYWKINLIFSLNIETWTAKNNHSLPHSSKEMSKKKIFFCWNFFMENRKRNWCFNLFSFKIINKIHFFEIFWHHWHQSKILIILYFVMENIFFYFAQIFQKKKQLCLNFYLTRHSKMAFIRNFPTFPNSMLMMLPFEIIKFSKQIFRFKIMYFIKCILKNCHKIYSKFIIIYFNFSVSNIKNWIRPVSFLIKFITFIF